MWVLWFVIILSYFHRINSSGTVVSYDCINPKLSTAQHSRHVVVDNSPDLFLCGTQTLLSLTIEIPTPSTVAIPTTSLPVALTAQHNTCKLHSDVNLVVVNSQLAAMHGDVWTINVSCVFPSNATERNVTWEYNEAAWNFSCSFTTAFGPGHMDVDTMIPPYLFLSDIWSISNLSLINRPVIPSISIPSGPQEITPRPKPKLNMTSSTSSPLIGIGQNAQFQFDVTGAYAKERSASLSGTCMINGQVCLVHHGVLDYTVQLNDSDTTGLTYMCTVMDAIGYTRTLQGLYRQLSLTIDGSLPILEKDVFILFSSDKPAHISSVISITVEAMGLIQGYTGNCVVNNVTVPLLAAEEDGFYMIQYTVQDGDESLSEGDVLPVRCEIENQVHNIYMYDPIVRLPFSIDAQRPLIVSTSLLFSSDRPAHRGTIIEIQIVFNESEPFLRVASNESCEVNNASVGTSLSRSTSQTYLLTYVVGPDDSMWKAGSLSIHCWVQDEAGNRLLIDRFTDGNTLFARELKPIAVHSTEHLPELFVIISFIIVTLASHSIANICPWIHLPRITGYLLTGILVGPYVLNYLTTDYMYQLRLIDEISMAFIGLSAGSKLHWNEMKPIIKSIGWITCGLTLCEYLIGTLTITILSSYIDFLQETSNSEKIAIALLAGCMMIARSPSSALAVIEETRATGHFTTLVLAVTVMCDVVVIILFNVNSMITESFLSGEYVTSTAVIQLVLQLVGSSSIGIIFGKLLSLVLQWQYGIKRKSRGWKVLKVVHQVLLLLYGWLIGILSHLVHPYLEPLLCCMVTGAILSNHNEQVSGLLSNLSSLVYVCFFTLTGASLELEMVVKAMALSLVLCGTRIIAIGMGSWMGGKLAGEDPTQCRVAWMAYLTQAGVTLGLAKHIQLLYPGWGPSFATMIVAVVICNQLVGPPLLRWVLQWIGDAKSLEVGKVDGLTALLVTCADFDAHESTILRLEMCGWNVIIETLEIHLDDVEIQLDDKVTRSERLFNHMVDLLQRIKPLEVVVVMMPTDAENYQVIHAIMRACHQLRRHHVLRVVVQLAGGAEDKNWAVKFAEIPFEEALGDTVDIVVIDRIEATDMLIELGACGKVVNRSDKQQQTTAIVMEEEGENEEDETKRSNLSHGVRLRQSLHHTVQRMRFV